MKNNLNLKWGMETVKNAINANAIIVIWEIKI